MKTILYLILVFSITSCASVQERARHHLNKALTLDPNILSQVNSSIRVDTTIIVKDTIITPEKQTTLKIKKDSLKEALNIDSGITKLLVENNKLKIELTKSKEGWLDFLTTIKSDSISYEKEVPLSIEKEVPVKVLAPTVITKKGYFYYSGIVLNIFMILITVIELWRLFKR